MQFEWGFAGVLMVDHFINAYYDDLSLQIYLYFYYASS